MHSAFILFHEHVWRDFFSPQNIEHYVENYGFFLLNIPSASTFPPTPFPHVPPHEEENNTDLGRCSYMFQKEAHIIIRTLSNFKSYILL